MMNNVEDGPVHGISECLADSIHLHQPFFLVEAYVRARWPLKPGN